jgi:hypothetical protein
MIMDLISSILVFLTSLLCVAYAKTIEPATAGLLIAYSLAITGRLAWAFIQCTARPIAVQRCHDVGLLV